MKGKCQTSTLGTGPSAHRDLCVCPTNVGLLLMRSILEDQSLR